MTLSAFHIDSVCTYDRLKFYDLQYIDSYYLYIYIISHKVVDVIGHSRRLVSRVVNIYGVRIAGRLLGRM